jgi:hypothetical protein
MRPLFDRDENLVGWIGSGCKHIFDADMRWVGYIERKNAWRASDGDWIRAYPVNTDTHYM